MKRSMRLTMKLFVLLSLAGIALLGFAGPAQAQTAGGEAKAVQATLFGMTTTLADTGRLASGASDVLQASSIAGSVPSLLTGDSLHATTAGDPSRVESEASLGSLGMTLSGVTLSADFVMARAMAAAGSAGSAASEVRGLAINGVPIQVTGAPNQTVPVAGGVLIVNEQSAGSTGAVANALHLIVSGLADVVIASAEAGAPPSSGTSLPPIGGGLPGLL